MSIDAYKNLEARFRQVARIGEAAAILGWDEAVMMPPGSAGSRNEVMAELAVLGQTLSTAPEIGEWLNKAAADQDRLSDWERANLREMSRAYVEHSAVPVELNRRFVVARAKCEQEWRNRRAQNDWSGFMPYLQEVVNLARETVQIIAKVTDQPLYDAAMDRFSPGLKTAVVDKLFGELRAELPGLIQEIVERQKSEKVIVPEGPFPMAAQKELAKELMAKAGFSFDHGRLDESHHPFCGGSSRDVRITTRYRNDEFVSSLMGVLHETGHALYEQNLPEEWLGQPVGQAAGMSIHESQSLFMEMQVCRSPEFMELIAPFVQKHMAPHIRNPESLRPDNLLKVISRVKPSLIRVDADEVTYPMHIILRFEIERDLIEDRWPLRDLPDVWDQKMKTYLGLGTRGNDKDGCMQDVHWPSGSFGYFPAYTFGAVIAAQLFTAMAKKHPEARDRIRVGDFKPIHAWLTDNIWSKGSLLTTLDLVESASGPLSVKPFIAHLRERYL